MFNEIVIKLMGFEGLTKKKKQTTSLTNHEGRQCVVLKGKGQSTFCKVKHQPVASQDGKGDGKGA